MTGPSDKGENMADEKPKAPKDSEEISDAQESCKAGERPCAYDLNDLPKQRPREPKSKDDERVR